MKDNSTTSGLITDSDDKKESEQSLKIEQESMPLNSKNEQEEESEYYDEEEDEQEIQ